MKESFTITSKSNRDFERKLSEIIEDSNLNLNHIKTKTTSKDFIITSITSELTPINKLLNTDEYDPNENIFILTISGEINFSSISWYIYTTQNQLIDLFDEMKKELIKNDKNILTPTMSRYFKLVKSYSTDSIPNNIDKIINYIQYFYNQTKARDSCALKEFLKISAISFYNNDGIKPFEGYAFKKAEPRIVRQMLKIIFSPLEYLFFKARNKRWIILKDDMICYMNDPNKMVGKNVYWFDANIEIYPKEENIIEIKNLSINLNLKYETKLDRDLWYMEINKRIEKKKEEIMSNIYHSFTSQKTNCRAKWFIDGENYFNYLFEQLKNAKESVYITDWFLSPPVALKRPINYEKFIEDKNDYKKNLTFENASRLMDVLYLLAKRGVRIFILLFYEIKLALPLNSFYAKTTLKDLHPNIKVTRHPKGSSSILWSHHEKLVIIDQQIAFVGGLDLCWGRFDTHSHPIVEEERVDKTYYYPGADYMSERTCDMHDVDKFNVEQIDRKKYPRFGWHDVHTMVEGPIVGDIMRHFVERWNFARSFKRNNQLVRVGVSMHIKNNKNPEIKKYKTKNYFEIKNNKDNNNNDDDNIINSFDNNINNNDDTNFSIQGSKTFRPKKYSFKALKSFNINQEDNKEKENNDKNIIINNKDNNIIQEEDDEESKEENINEIESEENINNDNNKIINGSQFFNGIKDKIKNKYANYKNKYTKNNEGIKIKQKVYLTDEKMKDTTIVSNFRIQALRSVCSWSIGFTQTEHSILEGYYKLIDNAKHYIYIENQFFVTKPYSEDERNKSGLKLKTIIENEIALHIRNRIELAYEKKENFKVFICIPLLPGFPGVPGESSTLDVILKHTLQSIGNYKGYSLLELLRKKMGNDVDNYIYFFSLRNHGTLNDIPVTELIYVHSKLLIVDDQKVLIGSANINDRSMLGIRDSEFAVIMEEDLNYDSIMDGQKYSGSKYAITLRKSLMSEHFNININDKILDDPLNSKLWIMMKLKAENNTFIYEKIFDCFPHNKFNNFKKLKERKMFKTEEEIEELKKNYRENINKIDGHIVVYPYEFLKDEELNIDFFSKENLVPERNFT